MGWGGSPYGRGRCIFLSARSINPAAEDNGWIRLALPTLSFLRSFHRQTFALYSLPCIINVSQGLRSASSLYPTDDNVHNRHYTHAQVSIPCLLRDSQNSYENIFCHWLNHLVTEVLSRSGSIRVDVRLRRERERKRENSLKEREIIPGRAVSRQPRVSKIIRGRTHALLCMQHCNLHRLLRIVVGHDCGASVQPRGDPIPERDAGVGDATGAARRLYMYGGTGDSYVLCKHLHA